MLDLHIEYLPVGDITPYEKNARKHQDEDLKAIISSIQEFGFDDPIGIWSDKNIIVEGHGRLMAAKALGMKEVPCIRLDHLTDEQRKAYALAHNKTAELSEWDFDLLSGELDGILDIDMSQFGFDVDNSEPTPDTVQEDDFEPIPPAEPKSKPGQVYKLGEHVLMCGDSTKEEDVAKLMGDAMADLVVTDPPYNVAVGDKNKFLNKFQKSGLMTENIAGDAGMTDEQVGQTLWLPAFERAIEHSKDNCSLYVTMPQGGTHMMMMMMIARAGWQVKHELIWVKNAATFSLGRLDYDYRHEPILYGWNKTHSFYAKDYITSVLEDQNADFAKMKKEELVEICQKVFGDDYPTSVIRENKPQKCDLHPTMKPIKLLARLIHNSSRPGEIVLDLFGGSGSTLIACEQLNRKCYMMEYEPKYVDVIIDRWESFTGEKAELLTE